MSTTSRYIRAVGVGVGLSGLLACTPNYSQMGDALSQMPQEQESCAVPFGDVTVRATGAANCDKLFAALDRQQARQAAKEICAGMGEPQGQVSNEENRERGMAYVMCVDNVMDGSVAIALADAAGGRAESRKKSDKELAVAMMMNEANNATQINTALIGLGGQLGIAGFGYLATESQYEFLGKLADAAGMPSSVHVTKSDDGGVGGEGGSADGGGGDQYVLIGDRNQAISRSDGSVATQGRNPNLIGTGQPESSLDPSVVNNQAENGGDIDNAPVTETSDDDGGQRLF